MLLQAIFSARLRQTAGYLPRPRILPARRADDDDERRRLREAQILNKRGVFLHVYGGLCNCLLHESDLNKHKERPLKSNSIGIRLLVHVKLVLDLPVFGV
jgi:hypothetical protein